MGEEPRAAPTMLSPRLLLMFHLISVPSSNLHSLRIDRRPSSSRILLA
jgi:hypothetical protein